MSDGVSGMLNVSCLYNTAWMREMRSNWVPSHVDGNRSGKIDLVHPFVSSCFATCASTVRNIAPVESDLAILNLGILIVELWHNQNIDSSAKQQITSSTNHLTLVKAMQDGGYVKPRTDFLATVYEPAARCVDRQFDVIDIDLGDDQIQQSIVEGVIRPLWKIVADDMFFAKLCAS